MSLFKRLSATFVSRVDRMVGEIENHEAIVRAGISEIRDKIAEARVRANRVQSEATRLRNQAEQLATESEQWRSRAADSAAAGNEQNALECLRRSRNCQNRQKHLDSLVASYRESAEALALDINTAEQRLAETQQKLTTMRARHSTVEAINATCADAARQTQLMEDTFDRWEINIGRSELRGAALSSADPITREFEDKEEEQALREELAALMSPQASEEQNNG